MAETVSASAGYCKTRISSPLSRDDFAEKEHNTDRYLASPPRLQAALRCTDSETWTSAHSFVLSFLDKVGSCRCPLGFSAERIVESADDAHQARRINLFWFDLFLLRPDR